MNIKGHIKRIDKSVLGCMDVEHCLHKGLTGNVRVLPFTSWSIRQICAVCVLMCTKYFNWLFIFYLKKKTSREKHPEDVVSIQQPSAKLRVPFISFVIKFKI